HESHVRVDRLVVAGAVAVVGQRDPPCLELRQTNLQFIPCIRPCHCLIDIAGRQFASVIPSIKQCLATTACLAAARFIALMISQGESNSGTNTSLNPGRGVKFRAKNQAILSQFEKSRDAVTSGKTFRLGRYWHSPTNLFKLFSVKDLRSCLAN